VFGYLFLGIFVRSILGLLYEWDIGMAFNIEVFMALGSGSFHSMVPFLFGLVERAIGSRICWNSSVWYAPMEICMVQCDEIEPGELSEGKQSPFFYSLPINICSHLLMML